MKKGTHFASILAALLVIGCLGSCTGADETEGTGTTATEAESEEQEKTAKGYRVLEISNVSDGVSPVSHVGEVSLKGRQETKSSVPDKTGTDPITKESLQLTYEQTQYGYLFHNDRDEYESPEGKAICYYNTAPGRLDGYMMCDKTREQMRQQLAAEEGFARLTMEQCQEIARTYLSEYTDVEAYTLVSSTPFYQSSTENSYCFVYVRLIDGMRTSDQASILVSDFGYVMTHQFRMLGDMGDAPIPSAEELAIIDEQVSTKIEEIYSPIKDRHSYSYTIGTDDRTMLRMADGSYAMKYQVEVQLNANDEDGSTVFDCTALLVYFE